MRRSTRRSVPVLLALLLLILCAGAFLYPGAVSLFTSVGPAFDATANSAASDPPLPAYTSLSGVLTFSPALGESPVVEVEAIPDTHPDSPLRVTSGPGGRFAMDALAVGECYTVRVADAKRIAVSTATVTVNATAGEAANVTLHVVGAAAVSGRVVGMHYVYRPEVLAKFEKLQIEKYYSTRSILDPPTDEIVGVKEVAAAMEMLEVKEEVPLAGLEVIVANSNSGLQEHRLTDEGGNYYVGLLVPGEYAARINSPVVPVQRELDNRRFLQATTVSRSRRFNCAFFEAWAVYQSDVRVKMSGVSIVHPTHWRIVLMSRAEVSLGRFLARIAGLRFARWG